MGLPKKPKKQEAPKQQAPAPTIAETLPAEEVELKKQRGMEGFESTILTGALTPSTGRKKKLAP